MAELSALNQLELENRILDCIEKFNPAPVTHAVFPRKYQVVGPCLSTMMPQDVLALCYLGRWCMLSGLAIWIFKTKNKLENDLLASSTLDAGIVDSFLKAHGVLHGTNQALSTISLAHGNFTTQAVTAAVSANVVNIWNNTPPPQSVQIIGGTDDVKWAALDAVPTIKIGCTCGNAKYYKTTPDKCPHYDYCDWGKS